MDLFSLTRRDTYIPNQFGMKVNVFNSTQNDIIITFFQTINNQITDLKLKNGVKEYTYKIPTNSNIEFVRDVEFPVVFKFDNDWKKHILPRYTTSINVVKGVDDRYYPIKYFETKKFDKTA